MVTLDLSLDNNSDTDEVKHVLLQTDPSNLIHLTKELEQAVKEGFGRHVRRIGRIV